MAYIVKSAGAVGAPVSPLSRAPFDRQRDVYKLALMNSGDCKRMWNSFAAESPHMARLVVADIERERQEDAAATENVDKRLSRAEKLVTKSKKPKVTKARGTHPSRSQEGPPAALAAWLDSSDPWQRETARAMLESRAQ